MKKGPLGFHFIRAFCWIIQYCRYENSCTGKMVFLFQEIRKQCYALRGSLFITYIVGLIPLASLLSLKSWLHFLKPQDFCHYFTSKELHIFSHSPLPLLTQKKARLLPTSHFKGIYETCYAVQRVCMKSPGMTRTTAPDFPTFKTPFPRVIVGQFCRDPLRLFTPLVSSQFPDIFQIGQSGLVN